MKILVTDTLFIFDKHIKKLKSKGFEVVRLEKSNATEKELIYALNGVSGYILGGVEKLTKNVIDNSPSLKAVSFPGIGYKWLIPDWSYAIEKGILIANTPDAPTHATAEWAVMAALAMQRGIFEVGRTGTTDFKITKGLEATKIGIYGFGRIGQEIAALLQPFKTDAINYYSTHRHEDIEGNLGVNYLEEETLLSNSDVIFVAVPDEVGKWYFNSERLSLIKPESLLVSISHEGIINIDALEAALNRGVRVANDDPIKELFDKFGPEKLFTNSGHNAFNTYPGNNRASDMATESIINLLTKGTDDFQINN